MPDISPANVACVGIAPSSWTPQRSTDPEVARWCSAPGGFGLRKPRGFMGICRRNGDFKGIQQEKM